VQNLSIRHGSAVEGGGLFVDTENAATELSDTIIADNNTTYAAGVEFYSDSGEISLSNNLIANNTATEAAGGLTIFTSSSPVLLTNNTFAANAVLNPSTVYGGGAIYLADGYGFYEITLLNNIFWNNSAAFGADLLIDDPASTAVSAFYNYLDPEKISGALAANANNTEFNPAHILFVDPAAENYHLLPDAVCVDAGTNLADGLLNHDFEGQTRIEDGDNNGEAVVDMGADEFMYTCPGDIDRDKDVDGFDVSLLAGGMGNGVSLEDLAANFGSTGCP